MNANRHRIVFNRARGLFMAVAESASTQGKSPAGGGTTTATPPGFSLARLRPAAFAALLALGTLFAVIPAATAQVVAYKAAPASQRPTVLTAGNGVPLVNIQTPSAAGVSRNTYEQFDVQSQGVILNNSRTNTATQLGGWVQGNPWLARGSARVILNEVISANPSQLLGYVEVAGSAAQVVIANPAGVTCNGCGFINASRATLTTGTPQVGGGNLDSYRVEGGTIRIEGAGMDASRIGYTDLIARAVEVNAGLWAQTLKVTAGTNLVDAGNSQATPISPAPGGGPAPAFAIDVAQLGGMYAGKIVLVGTEAGVGVRNAGHLGASAGEVVVTVDGRLTNSGSLIAAGNVSVDASAGIANSGTLYGQGDLNLATRGDISNAGPSALIAAGNNASLAATGASSRISGDATAVFAAGLNADGSLAATGNLELAASEQLTTRGQQIAGGDLALTARSLDLADTQNSGRNVSLTASAGDIDLSRASTVASGTLATHTTQALIHNDAESNARQLDLTAASISNVRGEIVQTGSGDTTVSLAGNLGSALPSVDNREGRIASNSNNLNLTAHTLTNTDGRIEHAGSGTLAITADTLAGTRGRIASNGTLALGAQSATLDAGDTVAATIAIDAGTLSNRSGQIVQTGNGDGTLKTATRFDNTGGTLASNGKLTLATGEIDNRSGGQIAASGELDLSASQLANDQGRISAGSKLQAVVAQAVGNAAGRIVAGTDLSLTAARLDNTGGTLGAVAGALVANTTGPSTGSGQANLDNTLGRIEAAQNITLASAGLTNTDGIVVGNALSIDTRNQALGNTRGRLVAGSTMNLQTGTLTNAAGLIQATGDLAIDTDGQALANTAAGSILGQAGVTVTAGALNNAAGFLGAGGPLAIAADTLTNASGRIVSETAMSLATRQLDNRSGQIESAGALAVQASAQADNRAGLLRAGQALDITTASLNNANTLGVDQGIEGHRLSITANTVDNRSGALRADTTLDISSSGTLGSALPSVDNSAGLISSAQTVSVRDAGATRTLAIGNTGGTFIAGQQLAIDAASLSGGKLLSHRDLAIDLSGNLDNTGEVTANRNATLAVDGTLANSGTLQAGSALAVTAGSIDNQGAGEILAPDLKLSASDTNTLTNRGLIDGGDTRLDAVTLNNLGSGRIYGDHLAIAGTTVNNAAEGSDAPVIAARDRLDLGVGTLNNREGALIFSAGDLAIGGSLDAGNRASGRAGTINNASASIEALGALSLNATRINNTNEHFTTQLVTVGSVGMDEWAYGGRYRPDQVYLTWTSRPGVVYYPPASDGMSYMSGQGFFSNNKKNQVWLHTPAGSTRNFWLYSYTRTTQESQVATSVPGRITAGGDMQLAADTLKNDNSHILAGGNLTGTFSSVENTATAGQRIVRDSGTAWYVFYDRDHKDSDRDAYGYNPTPTIESISLTTARLEGNTGTGGSGTTVDARAAGTVGQSAVGANGANATLGSGSHVARITQVSLPGATGSAGTAVATVSSPGALSGNSLSHTNPSPTATYLIETDPRFASYRNWLTSDYMLKALALDPATTQKRLGDGFYEQRLITEQVARLTGRRFLVGYQNEEEQYKALMNAGIAYAKAWNLIPGVALSAEQMARLTTDLVWLVEQDVTLADGSTQKVLVPQLYARIKEGDLGPAGGLLADNTLNLNVSGDLDNLGTLAGRQLVSLSAENIRNLGGRITGEEVWLTARQDIDHLGGTLAADQRLDLAAGRNIAIESTTRSEGRRTHIDRIASLHVNNPGGTLQLAANGDISLLAAYLINHAPTAAGPASRGEGGGEGEPAAPGTTRIAAGNNLTLGTVSTAWAESVGDGKHARQESGRKETGSTLATTGDITLSAGSNLAARAASVTSSEGRILARAGNDLLIEAGESTLDTAEQHKYKSKGFLSSKKTTTRDTTSDTTAIASTFSGDSVTLLADRDIAVKGSNVVATNDTTLIAGRTLSIEAASESHNETHFTKTKQSGVFSSGGVGFTIGSKQNSTDQKTDATTAAKSTIGSTDGNVLLLAGEKYRQVGSDVIAVQGDIDIAAKQVDIVEARETSRTTTETKSKQSGLTIAITSPVITAIQTAQQMSDAAKDTSDPRMKALAAASTGLAGYNAYSSIQAGQGTTIDGKANQMPVTDDAGKVIGSRDATAAEQVGGVNLSISIGGSKSSSETTQTSDTAAVSNLTAGRDINIVASGDGANSDLTIQGAKATAARNLTLTADDEIRLLAARNTADQKSSNKNSSGSVGISFGTDGLLFNVGASGGRGKADGNDLTHTNTHVEAGDTLTLKSGGDTTIKGAVARGEKVIADIGKDLKIESLQDTSTYDSKQKSLGGSLSVGYGRVSGSVSASSSKIESDYASVTEQSGIRAGDQGFDVKVKGDTDLKGGAITSTQQAIDDNKNTFQTGGQLTLSDIQNKAEYKAKSASVNIGTSLSFDGALKPGGTSAGFGKDGDKAESMTLAAISDIAGNKGARTGDAETGIAKIFDQQKVQKEIDAQTKITQMFGQLASKAVGDYAETKLKEAQTLRAQGREQEANDLESQWGANGTLRLAAHTVVGGLTGGVSGAAGAAAGTLTAPLVAEALKDAGIGGSLATALTGIASTAVGAAVGGTAGASTALNEVANNYLDHPENTLRAAAKDKLKNCEDDACKQEAQAEVDRWNAEDLRRDAEFHAACGGALSTTAGCADMTRDLYEKLGTYAALDARQLASGDKLGSLTQAHKEEMQSYLDLIKTANADVRTSDSVFVRAPDRYDPDPYGVVNPDNIKDAYLVMKFGTEALAVANVNENGNYAVVTQWWGRNGMNNPPEYATGLMLTHVDAAGKAKQAAINEAQRTNDPYVPVDRYTLSYAPTTGFVSDLWSAFLTKIGVESESVLGLRTQIEGIQAGNRSVDWVAHSRGGPEFVQAASGSSVEKLYNNSIVFHAGANNKVVSNHVINQKGIGDAVDEKNRYRDNSNDLVPQIVGLRALTSPWNLVTSLISAPCLSSTFCTIQQSPHTLPANWNNLAPEAK